VSDFPVATSSGVERPEAFRIDQERPAGSDIVVFVLHGEVDLHVSPELRARLTAAIESGAPGVVVDLSRVTFLDSMALGVLLGALKLLRARGGELHLVVPTPELRRIFELTLLDEVFALARTRQEAFAAVAGSWGN
jgi:anti-sigma B factor antagonist